MNGSVFGQDYDYGLVEFSEPVDLTRTEEPMVTPVCLPPRGTEDTYEGRVGTVTGKFKAFRNYL